MPTPPPNRLRNPVPRLIALAAATTLLAACGGLPKRDDPAGPPRTVFETSKAPAAYAQCLRPKWLAERVVGGAATVDMDPLLASSGSGHLTLLIDGRPGRRVLVEPNGSGAKVSYWNLSHDFGSGKPTAEVAIQSCL